ncbi:MAG: hypothetical protein ACI3Y5_07010 [Prevotella sp.]
MSFEELLACIETADRHPDTTAWEIYYYLKSNYEAIGSKESRMLLATYMKLPVARPSVIHSCMLATSLKIAAKYSDFRLPDFLRLWGYGRMLRPEDRERQKGKDGHMAMSLMERAEKARLAYALRHPDARQGTEGIMPMVAVKMFETAAQGRKRRTVKLVAQSGMSIVADAHLFPCKPWEIQNRVFDILLRKNMRGEPAVMDVALSRLRVENLFAPVVGYIDGLDLNHGHYHVFDNMSRHFVAQGEMIRCEKGQFVTFAPVIATNDKFKTAVICKVLGDEDGLREFGTYTATTGFIDREKGYFTYTITSEIKPTTEGETSLTGSAKLSLLGDSAASLRPQQEIRILMFLRRGMDGTKRNHVAKVILTGNHG